MLRLNLRVARAKVAVTNLCVLGVKETEWIRRMQGPCGSNVSPVEEFGAEEVVVAKDSGVAGVLGIEGVPGVIGQRNPMLPSKNDTSDVFFDRPRALRHCGCLESGLSIVSRLYCGPERMSDLKEVNPQATESGDVGLQGGVGRFTTGFLVGKAVELLTARSGS